MRLRIADQPDTGVGARSDSDLALTMRGASIGYSVWIAAFMDAEPRRIMNILGHYAVAQAERSRWVRVGQVLPDLLSVFQRSLNPNRLLSCWAEHPQLHPVPTEALIYGIKTHLAVDADFHRSECFMHCQKLLLQALRGSGPENGLKRYAVAHILTELFFDHLLVIQTPSLPASLNHDLRSTEAELHQLVTLHESVDASAFSKFQQSIAETPFFNRYGSINNILQVLQRMLQRIKQRALNAAEIDAVLEYWETLKPQIAPMLNQFIASCTHRARTAANRL